MAPFNLLLSCETIKTKRNVLSFEILGEKFQMIRTVNFQGKQGREKKKDKRKDNNLAFYCVGWTTKVLLVSVYLHRSCFRTLKARALSFSTDQFCSLFSFLRTPLFKRNMKGGGGKFKFQFPPHPQFGYVLCYKRNVKDLKDEVEKLQAARDRVQGSVDVAVNNGKTITEDVKNWLDNVENTTKEAEDLLETRESANCFGEWLPNPVVRHPIGRKVKKMIPVIRRLYEESTKSYFQNVYNKNTPVEIVTRTPAAARSTSNKEDVLESRAKIIEEVVEALVDDKVSVIGVYGPPGVGKSKLLRDLETRVREENLFHTVVAADVEHNPDLERVQDEISDALGLYLVTEKSLKNKANRLRQKLEEDSKEKNILIILDGLWEKLKLEEIGIPCVDGNKVKGCKLLLTSRHRGVLRDHMGSDREFELKLLELGEARKLFEKIVGNNYLKFKPMVGGVVENCGGLPLVIHSVGTRLRHGDSVNWRNALNDREGSDVKSVVQKIYEGLPEGKIKLLFSVCVLTSGKIRITDFVAYYMGLGLDGNRSTTIEEARDKLILDLRSLRDYSLLRQGDDMKQFRMHDLFVDVGIAIASTNWGALVGKKDRGLKDWSKDELRECPAISFCHVGIDELPEKLDCPKLRMFLLLEKKNSSLKISDSFFVSMEKLQVLHLAGLSFTSLPSSIGSLENLRSLSLDSCVLKDVTAVGKLEKLQFLSFTGSKIARLSREIGEIGELRFLDLRGCVGIDTIEPGMLERLVNLEELYIDRFYEWEAEDKVPRSNASPSELKSMKKLRTLYITIPQSVTLSSDLPFGNLEEHRIHIGGTACWWRGYKESRILELTLDSDNLLREAWMQQCLKRTQDLRVAGLQYGSDSIHDLCIEGFEELKHLHVQNSLSFQYVVDSTQRAAFTRLESLVLKNLNNLKKICRDCPFPESLSKLKTVIVERCGATKQLFPSSSMRIFEQLEEITITRCCLMEQIIGDAKTDEIEEDTHVSCKLRRLTLKDLPEITSFYKTGQKDSLPSLESLTLSELPKLKYIWNFQLPSDDSKLKFLEVKGCASLLSFLPSNLQIMLQNLEAVTVENCQRIRVVFDFERPIVSEEVKILSGLTTLTLSNLPRLEQIWSKDPPLCLENLRALKVQNCENLRFIFSSSMAKTLQQIKEIKIVNCKLLEEIIDVQEEESKEAASISTIEFPLLTSLYLEELPNLRTFSCGTLHMHCPTLTRLKISGCPKMMTFSSFERKQRRKTADKGLQQAIGDINTSCSLPVLFNNNVLFPSLEQLILMSLRGLTKIWHNELSEESLCKLASITVRDCENLSQIFPPTLIGRLQSLEMIEVVNCTSLEALMEHVPVNYKKRQDCLAGLKEVKLWDLPKLNAWAPSSTEATLSLPILTTVSLCRCHSLRYLFTNDTSRTLDKLEMLDIFCCNNMEEVVVTQEREERNLKAVKFPHLHTLKLRFLKSLISFSLGTSAYEFPSLKKLSILDCTKLKAFIQTLLRPGVEMTTEGSAGFDESPRSLFDEKVVFPKLEELRLRGIQSRGFWENDMPDESFCQLKVFEVKQCPNLLNVIPSFVLKRLLHCMQSLTVESCPRLQNLFTMSMAKNLVQLQDLVLDGCEGMEYIVAAEEEKPDEIASMTIISKLVTLRLRKMIKLRSFCQGKHTSEWPSLKELTVDDCKVVEAIIGDASYRRLEGNVLTCQPLLLVEKVEFPKMESMKITHMDNMEQIWLGELASNAFTKLKTLEVKYCEKLSSIFSSHTILARFQNLKEITVTDCGSLEVVFQVQEFNFSRTHSTSKFELSNMKLERLPKMKHVWSGHLCGTLAFERLQRLEARSCKSLKSLFPVSEEDGIGLSAGEIFFPQLTSLILFELSELRAFYRSCHTITWPRLQALTMSHCDKMKLFSFACEFQSCQGTSSNKNRPALFSFEEVMPKLVEVRLTREDVVMMQQQQSPHYVFDNVRHLALSCYHDENDVFPSDFLLQSFPNLQELVVMCSSFEEIFAEDASGHGGGVVPRGGRLTDVRKSLQMPGELNRLKLDKLGNLRRVWKEGSLMTELLKQVKSLQIVECPSLSIVFPSSTSFQRLTRLKMENCDGLVHMGTCSAMTTLVHLTLSNCVAMEHVVIDDENGAEEFSFPKLWKLKLEGLPRLESFSPTDCAFSFPSLHRVVVKECPKMNIFCKGALRTPELYQVLLFEGDENNVWRWEGDLNTTVQNLSA